MSLKIGEQLVITTDPNVIGTQGVISVKNCFDFPPTLVK
jgi:hypothetical protein